MHFSDGFKDNPFPCFCFWQKFALLSGITQVSIFWLQTESYFYLLRVTIFLACASLSTLKVANSNWRLCRISLWTQLEEIFLLLKTLIIRQGLTKITLLYNLPNSRSIILISSKNPFYLFVWYNYQYQRLVCSHLWHTSVLFTKHEIGKGVY